MNKFLEKLVLTIEASRGGNNAERSDILLDLIELTISEYVDERIEANETVEEALKTIDLVVSEYRAELELLKGA